MILLTASWQLCVHCDGAPYPSLIPCQSYPLNKQSPQRSTLTVFSKKYKVDNKHFEIALTENTPSEQARQIHCASKDVFFFFLVVVVFSAVSSVLSNKRVEPSLAGEFLGADSPPLCDGGGIPPWECSIPQVKTRESESISTSNKASRHTYLLYCVSLCRPPIMIILILIITAPGGRKQSFSHHPGSCPSFLLYMPRFGQVGYEGHHHPHVHARSHGDGQGSQE